MELKNEEDVLNVPNQLIEQVSNEKVYDESNSNFIRLLKAYD